MSNANGQTEFEKEKVEAVTASSVTLNKSSAESITTERAQIDQSSVKHLETSTAQLDKSSIFKMNAETAVVSSAVTFSRADETRLVDCNAIYLNGPETTVEGDLKTVLFVGNASGNVHMIFDKNSALRFGLGVGASLVGLGALVRRLFR